MARNLVLLACALFAVTIVAAAVDVDAQQQAGQPAAPRATAPKAAAARPAVVGNGYAQKGAPKNVALPPLPTVSFEPVEPIASLRQVYEFAAYHPEVLQYIPCYCGCEQVGHKANHDCFVKSRGADGRITQWDAHGMGCAVCLGVGRRAMQLFNEGMSVADIRATIEREASRFPSHTPTPAPPKKS
jgi:hypothetical protein